MLDNMLGNLFGRSKKQSNVNLKDNTNSNNGDNSDPFVMVGQSTTRPEAATDESKSLYPQMTILTQEQFVGQTSSRSSFAVQRTISQSYNSPIDNIPFAPLTTGQEVMDPSAISDAKCSATIDRIQEYLSSKSQSEYNFQLENTILSESLLS